MGVNNVICFLGDRGNVGKRRTGVHFGCLCCDCVLTCVGERCLFLFLFFTVINVENKESGVKKISFETACLFVCLVRTAHNFVLQGDGGNCSSSSSIAFDTESVKCSVFIRAAAMTFLCKFLRDGTTCCRAHTPTHSLDKVRINRFFFSSPSLHPCDAAFSSHHIGSGCSEVLCVCISAQCYLPW